MRSTCRRAAPSRIPKNPAGDLPIDELQKTYDSLISSGVLALRNYLLFTAEAHRRSVQAAVGRGARAEGPDRRAQPPGCPRDQAGGRDDAGALHRRLPDGADHRGGDRAGRLRRGDASRGRSSRTTISCSSSPAASDVPPIRARTATSAWSTPPRIRSAATRRAGSRRARRWSRRFSASTSRSRSIRDAPCAATSSAVHPGLCAGDHGTVRQAGAGASTPEEKDLSAHHEQSRRHALDCRAARARGWRRRRHLERARGAASRRGRDRGSLQVRVDRHREDRRRAVPRCGACCRSSSRTSCRSARARGTSGSASSTRDRARRGRSARPTKDAASA